jgi:hypothetical protein
MKLLAITLALCTALPAQAGGPVIIEEPVEEGNPAALFSPGEKIALAAGLILLGAALIGAGGGGSDSNCSCFTPEEGGTCTC